MKMLIAAMLLLYAILHASFAEAYTLYGWKVKNGVVDIYMDVSTIPVNITVQEAQQNAWLAAKYWTDVPGSAVVVRYRGLIGGADICGNFSDGIVVKCFQPVVPCAGVANLMGGCAKTFSLGGFLTDARIMINSGLDRRGGLYVDLHEYGHIIGLTHTDASCKDVPSSVMCEFRETLSADDVAAVRFLYSEPVVQMNALGQVHLPCVIHGPATYWADITLVQDFGKHVKFDVNYAQLRPAPSGTEECLRFRFETESGRVIDTLAEANGEKVVRRLTINIRESNGLVYEDELSLELGTMSLDIHKRTLVE